MGTAATMDYASVFSNAKKMVQRQGGKIPTPSQLKERIKANIDMKQARKLYVDLKQYFAKRKAVVEARSKALASTEEKVAPRAEPRVKESTSFGRF